MSKYDDLFADTVPDDSVFAEKNALDPLTDPDEIRAREAQERELATIINGVHEGYLPPTVSIYGPPGTGKTLTTRRICREFAARYDQLAVEYVNLKECRTLFSAANEILLALTGEKKGAYEGLDGVFGGIWNALEDYPDWTVLLLDEIDHIQHDTNYDPSDFFYRLLRSEGKRVREINLSVWLLSNELLEVDLRLDSRVESAISDEQVFFPPYDSDALEAILVPRLEQAFCDGALPADVRAYGIETAAGRWGDARKALTLFRQAGETATERGLLTLTEECIDATVDRTAKDAVIAKLRQLPAAHLGVLIAVTAHRGKHAGEGIQPVTTRQIADTLGRDDIADQHRLGERAIREVVRSLETMGLIETWIESRGRDGRQKQIKPTFNPNWMGDLR